MTLKNHIGKIVLAAIILAAGAWSANHFLAPQELRVVNPTRGTAVQAVYATGTVEPTVMVPIAPRTSARLMELSVDEGSTVKKDQVLARMEADDLIGSLKELQAREIDARLDYDRKAKLLETGNATRETRDQAKANWDAARAAMSRAQSQVNFMKLVAPADGTIIRRDGEIGQLIPVNQAVLWMSCCAPLRVSAEVDEEDIAMVQPGQEVLIQADAFPNQTFKGKVQSITPKGDPVARSYRVRIELPLDTPLLIGMTAETNIMISETANALLIPSSAVKKNAEKVWVVKDHKLIEQKITVGARGQQQVEIKSGLSEDDMVVLQPNDKLVADQTVRPIITKPEN
jgi:membrane fusion protein, multidrug efflux system